MCKLVVGSTSSVPQLHDPIPTTGLVLEPLPVGAWAFLGVTVAVATKTLTFAQAFTAFTNDVIWLIVVSFFFAKARKWGAGIDVWGWCCT